jgi:thiamine-phosphate pyrophosphorylase
MICIVTAGAVRAADDLAATGTIDLARFAAAAGATMFQLREPGLPDAALCALAGRVRAALDRRVLLLINDRTDIAVAAGADGVHLRGDAMAASRVRAIAPPAFVIGRSVHSEREARDAELDGAADYLVFGTVFPSASKPPDREAAGLERLAAVCSAVEIPVVAIGGIDPARAPGAAAAGAAGIAAIGMFADAARAGDAAMRAAVAEVRRAFAAPGPIH